MTTQTDIRLEDLVFVEPVVLRLLNDLEVWTVRQLADRLRAHPGPMRAYLGLQEADFRSLCNDVMELIKIEFPEDFLGHAYPSVNKSGVPTDRGPDDELEGSFT